VRTLFACAGCDRCPRKWAERNRRFLELVYMRFDESGEWPRAEALQRDLLHLRDDLDVFERAEQLPRSLGALSGDSRVFLTVTGLAHLDAARDFLDDFLRVLILAVGRYRDGDRNITPQVCERDLIDALSLPDCRASRVLKIMASGCRPFAEGTIDHSVTVTPDVRHFVSVRSVRDYVKVLRKLERRHQREAPRALGSVRAWLGRRQIAIWESIIIAVVTGLIVAAAAWGISRLMSSVDQPSSLLRTVHTSSHGDQSHTR
jgi:hypothetical protein